MQITIMAWGTRGDIQPCVALAHRLKQAGHRVWIAALRDHEPFITGHGVEYVHMEGDFLADVDRNRIVREQISMMEFLKRFVPTADIFVKQVEAVLAVAEKSDVLIAGGGMMAYAGTIVAELHRLPLIQLAYQPFTPSRAYPHLALRTRFTLGAFYNILTNFYVNSQAYRLYAPPINEARQHFGLKKWSAFDFMTLAKIPVINAFSPAIFPRPRDWSPQNHIVGFFYLDDAEWIPPDDLAAFLAGGETPIFAGFGSVTGYDPADTTKIVKPAIDGRAIFSAGLSDVPDNDRIFYLDRAPHGWLFPKMRVIVHHGGAGTVANALRAGVPQVIVPHAMDQPVWGTLMHKAGVAPAPIPRAGLTADQLRNAIDEASTLKSRATELAGIIRGEDGTGEAVRIIESYAKQ